MRTFHTKRHTETLDPKPPLADTEATLKPLLADTETAHAYRATSAVG